MGNEEAIFLLSQEIEMHPKNAGTYLTRGLLYFTEQNFEKALPDFDRAIELDPENVDAYLSRGVLYSQQGNYERALPDLERAIELDSDYAKAYCNRGWLYGYQEIYEKAIPDFDRAIELDSEYGHAYFSRALSYFLQNNYGKALPDFDRAIELDSECVPAYFNRAQIYASQENYEKALSDFDRVIELDSEYAKAYFSRGWIYIYGLGENYEEAIRDFSTVIEIDPEHVPAYFNRAKSYFQQKSYEKALLDFDRVIELDPEHDDAYCNRGVTYSSLCRYEEAIRDYSRAIDQDPNCAEAFKFRSATQGIMGNKTEADRDYSIYLSLQGEEKQSNDGSSDEFDNSKDIGIRTADYVYSEMQIDEEWSVRSDREFTWWGFTLPQRIWAGPTYEIPEGPCSLVSARMTLSVDVEENEELYQKLSLLNSHATLGAIVYDPDSKEIFHHASVEIHEQIEEWTQYVFLHAVAIQAADGLMKSAQFLTELYWQPPISEHPTNGPREHPDGMLSVLQDVHIPEGIQESKWSSEELQEISGKDYSFLITGGETGFTAEWPYTGHEPAMVTTPRGEPLQTALLRPITDQSHSTMGNGCLMTLTLPITPEDPKLANQLNLDESRGDSDCHLLGAWYIGPQGLSFATFMPNGCYMPGLLNLLFQRNWLRMEWAKRHISAIS